MTGIGVDVVSMTELRSTLDNAGDTFLRRVFAPEELAAIPDGPLRLRHVASRFAAKEAVFKCLRATWSPDASFADIVVTQGPRGAPEVTLRGSFAAYGASDIVVSLSTAGDTAVAVALQA